jgi:putative tricarboxylic transport membrane protein
LTRGDVIGGGVVFLFGAVTVLLSLGLPIGTLRSAGSGLFPLCLGVLLMLLSAAFVLRPLVRAQGEEQAASPGTRRPSGNVLLFLGAMALATLLLNDLGYPLVSFLLLLALFRALGLKRWVWSVVLAFSAATVSYVLFVQWLKIPLPKGWIGL